MRVAVATRSMNHVLYQISGELLGREGCAWPRYRLTGTDSFGYFRELLAIDADWLINLDEDAFLIDPERLVGLVHFMEAQGYAACGMPDGGVVPIRRHHPAACNAFFNVFDLRRVRPVWQEWERVQRAGPRPEYEQAVADFARRSVFAFDHFERYYGAFFALLDASQHFLYLDAETWTDGISTLLKDHTGEPLLLHCWYSRYFNSSYHTRQRYQAAIDFARRHQGRGPVARKQEHNETPAAALGCVLAIQDRPADMLHRALQTYGYQSVQPIDRVLLDYGSASDAARTYQELCRRYGWRYVWLAPPMPGFSRSAACNAAVAALDPRVTIVFKSDVDMLLGEGILAQAIAQGRNRLCIFPTIWAATEQTTYPAASIQPADLARLAQGPPLLDAMDSDGVHAFPRDWFNRIGGYDLEFETWRFEDSDLRERAKASIGVVLATSPLLIHQWHPRHHVAEEITKNLAYYDRMKGEGVIVRNGGKSLRLDPPHATAASDGAATVVSNGLRPATTPAPSAPDLWALVLPSARRVLDLAGNTPGADAPAQAQRPYEVATVQPSDFAGKAVKDVGEPFDCMIAGHLLSCVRDPARWLRRARHWLTPQGHCIALLPNARHHRLVAGLLQGVWRPEGVPGYRPLRFFTRREIEKLFYRTGWNIELLEAVSGPDKESQGNGPGGGEVDCEGLRIGGMLPAEAAEFYITHYLVRATPAAPVNYGLTSIVILTHNQLDYTRQCIDSIRQYTDEPYELIVVDNGSTDATPDYLRALAHVQLILNPDNRGFPAGANQGIKAAIGRQILLLNNDTLVTTGWLGRLLRALHSDPHIGLAGPCSNCVSGEQQVPAGYDDLTQLDGFAWDWGKANNRQLVENDRLVGFCLLIRREVIDAIGLLDECFGIGCFEDDDYCLRALRAGFRAVIARDAFVHHFGGRTFVGNQMDFGAVMRHNQQLFRDKWAKESALASHNGRSASDAEPSTGPAMTNRYRLRLASGGGLLLERASVTLSMCMIVRDNARTIEAALTSIRPWVDEMIVVDTGSTDQTPDIARRLGARVYHFPWCKDFSAARNESIRHARGRWIFWMDSDDTIDPQNGRGLRQLALGTTDPTLLGFVVQVYCPGKPGEDASDMTIVDHVKLFRNLPELRFDGRIHEQILGAIRRAGGTVAETGLFVLHSGYDQSPEGQARKLERDLELLHLELKERPQHPFTLFNLGMTYADCGKYQEAVDYLQGSLQHSSEQDSHLRKVFALLVHCYSQLNRSADAWDACQQGLRRFPKDAELLFRKGLILQDQGRRDEAAEAYRYLLGTSEPGHFKSVTFGIRGFKARQNLALVYQELGDNDRAEVQWQKVVEELPHYRPGWLGLGEVLLRQTKVREVQNLIGRLEAEPALWADSVALRVKLAAMQGDLAAAWQELERAERERPREMEPLQALCQFLFEHGQWTEAERALKELVRRAPKDASAYHNLGLVYRQQGRAPEAAEAFRQALRLQPDRTATQAQLHEVVK